VVLARIGSRDSVSSRMLGDETLELVGGALRQRATPFRAHRLFDETPVEQGGWDSGSPWFFPLFFLSRQILLQLLGCFLLARL